MNKHSPLPWDKDAQGGIFDVTGVYVATARTNGTASETEDGNATHIVQACNAYEDHLELLRRGYGSPGRDAMSEDLARAIHAALRDAGIETPETEPVGAVETEDAPKANPASLVDGGRYVGVGDPFRVGQTCRMRFEQRTGCCEKLWWADWENGDDREPTHANESYWLGILTPIE